ncbi:hypothetical protein SEVIR_3G016900v4 [Setaria viridis]|uniref:Leucine-rich repeat-containing N-terminal plant-type domain-containing protein n=3 Tax=Setaria TaxID=4554 RepID=K3ZD94_SETIT|nr:DNA damage-repair/toleration protein DRT100 [Setaria italica]XP_034585205.1 DNA damage-repair/toleration protein DRT100 [Setaria viridis]
MQLSARLLRVLAILLVALPTRSAVHAANDTEAVGAAGHDDDRPSPPCSPADRAALLGFKAGVAADTTGILATWAGNDCCGAWEGVTCDAATGRVVALQLEAPPPKSRHYMQGALSPSLAGLEFLQALVIRDMGRIGGAIPAAMSRLTRLRELYLEGNMLAGAIPGSLGKLGSLQYLSLAGNRLDGQLPPELGAVSGLEQINVARNSLSGAVPPSYKNLSRLAYLDMSNNLLSGAVPGFIGQFKNLALLDLSNNSFSGEIPASLCTLHSLTDLSLSHNKLGGQIPPQMGSLRSLNSLAMDDNMFVGSIPASFLGLQKLWYMNLSRNGLSGPLPTGIRNALPSLVSMDLSHNHLIGDIDQFFRSLSTAINDVKHSNNPSQIVLPQKLEHLDLSENRITGALPDFARGAGLKWLDISSNAIGGQIPISISKLSNLERLDISRNRVRGIIPASMAEMVHLQWLDLSSNALVGRIPDNFTRLTSVRHASFRRNKLCGQIPQVKPFNLFHAAAYAHNLCLCGKPLPPCRKI